MDGAEMSTGLFSPLQIRGMTARNRIAIAPMGMYSGTDGAANDFHVAHYGRFALGGAGLVIIEATAVSLQGRNTCGDLGLWADEHVAPLAAVVRASQLDGTKVGIQLVHAGRKAARQRPWEGNGPLTAVDAARGDAPWPIVGPTALAMGESYQQPQELSLTEIAEIRADFTAAARRALSAGVDFIEIHAAHGFLLHSFMAPAANLRSDGYGGNFAGRHRLVCEVARDIRAVLPASMPLFMRISMHDGATPARPFDETLQLAAALKGCGVDVIDCSAGGISGHSASLAGKAAARPGFQLEDTARIRGSSGAMTMAVGLILAPEMAEAAIRGGQTDIVGIGREALWNPNWPLQARFALSEAGFEGWSSRYRWSLEYRAKLLERLAAERA